MHRKILTLIFSTLFIATEVAHSATTKITTEPSEVESFTDLTSESDSSPSSNQMHEGYGYDTIQLNLLKHIAMVKVKAMDEIIPRLEQIHEKMSSLLPPNSPTSISTCESEVDKAGNSLVTITEELMELQKLSNRFASFYHKTLQQRDHFLASFSELKESSKVGGRGKRANYYSFSPLSPLNITRIGFATTPTTPTTTAASTTIATTPIPSLDPPGEEISASINGRSWTLEITNMAKVAMENFQPLLQHVNWNRRAAASISPGSRVTLAFSGPAYSAVAVGVYQMGDKYAIFRFAYTTFYEFSFGFLRVGEVTSLSQLVNDDRLYSSAAAVPSGGQGNFSVTTEGLVAQVYFSDRNYKYVVKVAVREA